MTFQGQGRTKPPPIQTSHLPTETADATPTAIREGVETARRASGTPPSSSIRQGRFSPTSSSGVTPNNNSHWNAGNFPPTLPPASGTPASARASPYHGNIHNHSNSFWNGQNSSGNNINNNHGRRKLDSPSMKSPHPLPTNTNNTTNNPTSTTTPSSSPLNVRFRDASSSSARMSSSQGEYEPPTFLFEDGDFLDHVHHHGSSNNHNNNHNHNYHNYNNNNNSNHSNNNYNDNILQNIHNNTIHANDDDAAVIGNGIPTETQLVLLCLDYLRDLRRSYPNVEDMTHAEGLDGDCISLAVWALSRAFVRPGKLTLRRGRERGGDGDGDEDADADADGNEDGDPTMATTLMSVTVNGDGTLGLAEDGHRRKHKHHDKKEVKVPILAAGGLNGEKAFGNDAWYRQLSFREERELQMGMEGMIGTNNENDNNYDEYPDGMMQQRYRQLVTENSEKKSVARLTNTICIPSIEDITNEVMLRIPIASSSPSPTSPDDETNDEEIQDSTLIYEYNDNHASNAHRFYLLRGLASGTNDPSTSQCNRRTHPSLHGGPIALGEIAVAGLAALGARSRIDAEREMVFENPLFEQFVKAAASKGFFQEKKEDGEDDRDRGGRKSTKSKSKLPQPPPQPTQPTQPPDEQRSKTIYEEKYRKVVTKFRSKLAMKMEADQSRNPPGTTTSRGHTPMSVGGSIVGGGGSFFSSSPMHHPLGGGLGRTSPYHPPHPRGAASPSNASVHSTGGDSQASLQNWSVAERHRVRREIRMERSRMHRDRSEERRGRDGIDAVFRRKVPPSGEEQEGRGRRRREEVSRRESASQSMDPSPRRDDAWKGRKGMEQDQKHEPNRHPPQHHEHHEDENEDDEDASPALPREPEQLNSEGNRLMQQKRFEDALDCYSAALELAPEGPNSHVYYSNRAAAFLSINDYESCIDDSERALSLKPDYAKAHARLGLAYFVSGRYGEAVRAYEEALEHDPENEWCKGHYEQAKLKLEFERQKTRSAAPKNRTNTSQPHLSHSSQELQQQQQQHQQIHEEVSDQEDFQSDDEGEEEELEEEEEEEEVEEEEENDDGEDDRDETPIKESLISDQNKNNSFQTQTDDQLPNLTNSQKADDHKDRGNSYMSSKEYEKAVYHYTEAISICPNGPNSHVYYSNRAAAFCYLGRYQDAADDCMQGIELNPSYEKAHARLGLSLFFMGDYQGAVDAYEVALELDPKSAASLSYLGKARSRLEEQQRRRTEKKEGMSRKQQDRQQRHRRDAEQGDYEDDDEGEEIAW